MGRPEKQGLSRDAVTAAWQRFQRGELTMGELLAVLGALMAVTGRQAITRLRRADLPWRPLLAVFLVLALGSIVALVRAMPDDEAYALAAGNLTTELYDRDGELFAELYWDNRIPVAIDDVPDHTLQAFIAVEDARFYRHKGVDPTAILRAFLHNLRHRDSLQGGSTITQQLARNAFDDIGYERTLRRKVREAMVAVSLERRYTKDEILEAYVNQIYLGEGAYGLGAAARVYFDKDVGELTLAESALLAGLPVAPSRYTPFTNLEGAKARQGLVLDRMIHDGLIEAEEAEAALESPLEELLVESPELDDRRYRHAWFVDEVFQQLVEQLTDRYRRQGLSLEEATAQAERLIFTGGLQVETTLDAATQEALEAAVEAIVDPLDPLDNDRPPVQVAGIFLEPATGEIRALVGGREHPGLYAFIRATQATRQPGSAFKPVSAYGPALAAGHGPASMVDDSPFVSADWAPRNVDDRYLGLTTYREAVRRSVNIAAVRVMDEVGVTASLEYARRLGIENLVAESQPDGRDDRNLSTALGGITRGVTPLELTRAFAVFANEGVGVEPTAITRVTGPDGRVIWEAQSAGTQAIASAEAYLMTDMLRTAVRSSRGPWNSDGYTGWRAVEGPVMSRWDVAGKTGTSDDNADIWFVGYTRELAGAVWMGYDVMDGERRPVRLGGVTGFGGLWPTMIWNRTMAAAHAGLETVAFRRPDDIVEVTICIKSGLLPEAECGQSMRRTELFIRGTEPTATGDAFTRVRVLPIDRDRLADHPQYLERDPFLRERPYLRADDSCTSGRTEQRVFLNRQLPDLDTVRRFRELAYDGEGSLRRLLPADLAIGVPVLSCADAPELADADRDDAPPKDLRAEAGPEEGDAASFHIDVYREALGPHTLRVYEEQAVTVTMANHRRESITVRDPDGETVLVVEGGGEGTWSSRWDEEQDLVFTVEGEEDPTLEFTIEVLAREDGNADDDDQNGGGLPIDPTISVGLALALRRVKARAAGGGR